MDEIDEACVVCGRPAGEVRLMAVTKFHTVEDVREAYKAGIKIFGENRVQEALSKFKDKEAAFPDAELHLIGSLQRNKAKNAATFFDCIESCDRDEILAELAIRRDAGSPPLPVLLEQNTGEESKRGYKSEGALLEAVEKLLNYKNLKFAGLMTMAPFTDDMKIIRGAFRALVRSKENIEKNFPQCFKGETPILSMGMSNDYRIAIEEGSTLVRIGTSIFGERRL